MELLNPMDYPIKNRGAKCNWKQLKYKYKRNELTQSENNKERNYENNNE